MAAWSDVAKKFYPTEEDRLLKMNDLKDEMGSFFMVMKELVEDLWAKDIRFVVFDMLPGENPPRLHAGIVACCSGAKKDLVTDELRRTVAEKIVGSTKYKDVKWEI